MIRMIVLAILCAAHFSTIGVAQGIPLRGHDGWIGAVAFSPDGKQLATGSADHTIRVWSVRTGKDHSLLKGHKNAVVAVAYSPNGRKLASAGFDGQVILWAQVPNIEATFFREREIFTSLAFSPDGRELAVGSVTGAIHLLDAATLQPIGEIKHHKSWVNAVRFAPDGTLATGSSDNTVVIWKRDKNRFTPLHSFSTPEGEVRSLAFTSDGQKLAAGIRYGTIRIFDAKKGALVTNWKGHLSDVWSVSFSPDGRTLATGNGDWDKPGEVKLWDTRTWKEKATLPHTGEVLSLAYSPDGTWLAVGGWDKSVRLWNLDDPKQQAKQASLEFHVTQTISKEPFTGRVFVMLSKSPMRDYPSRPSWFNTQPFFAKDVKNWQPGTKVILGEDLLGFPVSLNKLPADTYFIQAVVDFDKSNQHPITGEGNAFSKPTRFEFDPDRPATIELNADQLLPGVQFKETDRVKLVDIESKLLTVFHGRPIRMRAGVVLPKSFATNLDQKYPVIYEIPGFSGAHHSAHTVAARNGTDVAGVEMLYVVLDPTCRLGHHVFADSDNNGPWGRALVEELIPFIEQTYRGQGEPRGRFVTGHSSGGWSSLWLQVAHADFFGGVWSTAPDPVDFRDFQRINIYEAGVNMFTDAKGQPRPLARSGERILLYFKPFSDMEVVLGRGEQLFSFEAVFGPKGDDGHPRPLWNRVTGAIDPVIAKSWERYDIRRILERSWSTLAPKLRGKIHVYMGSQDTFYLEGATILLKESLAKLGSDAVVEILPGRNHSSLLDRALRERIAREMAAQAKR